ncbi:hypothetical protein ACQP3L_35150, partial [Escherichia coli]
KTPTQDKYSAHRRFICPRGTEGKDKGQRQEIDGDIEAEGSTGEGRGGRGICSGVRQEDKGLPLDREETNMTHRQMVIS